MKSQGRSNRGAMYQNSYGGMMPSQMGAQQYGYGGDGVLGAPPGYSHQATHHQATHHQATHHQAPHHQAPPYPVQAQQLQAQQLQAQQLQAQQLQQQQQYQQQYQQQQMLQQQQVGGSQQMPWGKSSTGATNHEPEPDPEMYETSVYLGIDDDEYDYRTKVIGEKGENLDYVRKSTGSKVLLRGKGSGVYNTRPPHIFISHSTLSGMEDAEKLAYNLVKSVKEDYQEWKSKGGSKAASRAQSGGSQHTGSRESSHVHNYNHGDRGQQQQQQQQQNQAIVKDYGHSSSSRSNRQQSQYDDSSRYSGSYLQDSSSQQRQSYDNGSSQNNNMQQQQQGGRGDGDRYGRSSQPDQRSSMQSGNRAGSSMQGTLYCDICNIHCPNRDMYERHMAGGMHLESVRHNQQKKLAGMRQMDNRGQQRSQPADLGGTHWEGPPEPLNPQQQQWQDLDTGVTLEDYVFTQCEKVLKTMISDIGLRNLKRSVEKIGQRDLKSAIPTQPQTNNYCKLCKETVPNMPQHLTVKSHGNMYLLRQIQLGDLFMDYYSDVPIPGVITNGGRVLAMDTLAFGPYIPETNRERFKELLVYSGAYLAYKCSVCTTNITCLGNWVQHTTSKRHGRAVIENILMYGIEAFIAKNPHIPVPPPRNALEILSSIDNISTLHPTIPRRRSTQIASSGGSEDQTTTGYQQLASLSAQERQLVLQVQALTGIDDLTLVINVLTALGGMDPAMLQTLSALDPLAIQHAVSGNVALQGMDVKFVQKVIKMYMNYKGIPMPTVQQSQQYMTTFRQQQQQSQVVQMSQLRQMYNQQRVNQAQANWVSGVGVLRGNQRSAEKRSGSRWDDGNSGRQDMSRNDRGRKDRDRDRQRGSTDNKGSIKSPAKGKTDNKNRNDKGKPDSKDKKPDNKSDKSKTDKAKTDNKTDKTKTDNKKDVSKETTGKRPGGKVTEPPAKKAAKDSKDAEVLIDLTDEDAVEKKKNDAKNTEEKNEEEKKDAVEKKEEKEETKEEVKEEMETESKEKAEEQKPSTDEEKSENTKTEAKEEAEKEIVEIKDDSDADMKEETKKEEKEEDKQEDLPKPKVEETSEDKETPASSQEDDDIKEVAISEKELIGKSPRGRGRGRRSRGRGRGAAAGTRKTRASIRGKKEEADEVDKSAGEAEKTEDEAERKEEEPEKKEEEPEKAEDLNTSANESFSLENLETVDEYVADEEPETKKECKEGDIEKTDVKKDEEKETVDTTEKAAEEEAAEEGVDVDMDEGAEGDADCTEEIDEDKLLGDDDEEMQEEAKE